MTIYDLVTIIETPLDQYTSLADGEAALYLHQRMRAFDWIDAARERSFAERGLIAQEFERRRLWEHIDDPQTRQPFASFNAWMSSGSIGGRAINFEAKRDVEALADIPQAILREIPKANIKVMRQLSTHVRQTVMDAAAKMAPGELLDYIDACHPDQHIEVSVCMKFKPERSGAALIEEALTWAIEHELAGTRDEAIIRMAETALEDWKLDHELEEVMNNAANA